MCLCGLKASPLFFLCGITLGSWPLCDPTVFMRKTTGGLYPLLLLLLPSTFSSPLVLSAFSHFPCSSSTLSPYILPFSPLPLSSLLSSFLSVSAFRLPHFNLLSPTFFYRIVVGFFAFSSSPLLSSSSLLSSTPLN